MLKTIFKELGLSETTHKIYSELLEKGALTARQLADNLAMPRPSVYDHMKILSQRGLVVERNEDGKTLFAIDDVKHIPLLLDEQITRLQKEKNKVEDLLPMLASASHSLIPKIRFYSGVEGVRHVLNDFRMLKNAETEAMWPIKEMIDILGKDYFDDLNRRRIRNNTSIRGIWPRDKGVDFKNHPFMGTGKGFLREIRVAPKGTTWDMGYWIYGDKVAFVSSSKETYGFTIHSRDFSNMMRAQFEVIWKSSTKKKPEPRYTDAFLKTI